MKTRSLYPIIVTAKVDETIKFYSEVFDYSVKHDGVTKTGGRVIVLANPDDLEIELIEQMEGGPISLPEGLYGFRINVANMDDAISELNEKGAQIIAGPFETANGRNLMIKDSNGINITLIEHNRKK